MNDRLYEANKSYFGSQAKPIEAFESYGPVGPASATRNSRSWLNSKIVNDAIQVISPDPATRDVRGELSPSIYSDMTKVTRRSRVQSAVTRSSRSNKTLSRYSQSSTFLSRVPELAPFELMNIANEINIKRSVVVSEVQSGKTTF